MNLRQAIEISIPILDREQKTLIVSAQYAKFGKLMPRAVGAKKRLDEISEAISILQNELSDTNNKYNQPSVFFDNQK